MSDADESSAGPRSGAGEDSGVAAACALEARGLVVDRGRGRGRRRVLQGVDVRIDSGQIVGLVGPNGAGKTTLLETLTGRLRPQRGEIRLGGDEIPTRWSLARRARAGLGYLPQGPSVFRELSVWENLRSVPGADPVACAETLARIGLAERRDALGRTLSGGERRRLELGRLFLLQELRVVLCDEPFAGLDPIGVSSISDLLVELVREHDIGLLVTDHRFETLFGMCDIMIVLLDGSVAARGAPSVVSRDPAVASRYLGEGDFGL